MKKPFPRISTRGYYNLDTGNTLKSNPYFLYPKKFFDSQVGRRELTIMMHGLRNDGTGALKKFEIARRKLKQTGYGHPVVGFSYDSNTKGAHLAKSELKALCVGQKIAKKNGRNLARFILDFKKSSPNTKIRLMGHSLGSQVIFHTVEYLSKNHKNTDLIESVYFFGSSIPSDDIASAKHSKMFQKIVTKKIINYFSPGDDVLKYAHNRGHIVNPIGWAGARPKNFPKYVQKKVRPKNHRFASYAATIRSYP